MKRAVKYAFGGFEEGEKDKKKREAEARKVDVIPDGYTAEAIDPAFPNRKYFRRETTATIPTVKSITSTVNRPVRRIVGGDMPSKKRLSLPTSINNSTPLSSLDRIFMESEQSTPTSSPVEAFMGDTVADSNGKTIGRLRNRSRNLAVGAGTNDTSQEVADFMYIQPDVKGAPVDSTRGKFSLNTKELQDIFGTGRVMGQDVSAYKNKTTAKFANGGEVDINGMVNAGKPILDGLMSLLEGNLDYSEQPIVNAATMRNMATPYKFALGGTIDDLDEDELYELQAQADELGITVEELLEQQAEQENEELVSEPEEVYEEDDITEEEFAMGGRAGFRKIEVEDDEVMQHPDGSLVQMNGNTHEEGGIDVNVPHGTKIYSDRLSVDGKTMQERKIRREKSLGKLNKLTENNSSTPLKNTLKRTSEIQEIEEKQDMALQEIAGKIYGSPEKAAYGHNGNTNPNMWPMYDTLDEYLPGQVDVSDIGITPLARPTVGSFTGIPRKTTMGLNPALVSNKSMVTPDDETSAGGMGVGDYVGMAGNLFNAIAPIVNTNNAAAATRPRINRFRGFGKDAIDTNSQAQDYAQVEQTNSLTDIDSVSNSSYNRNANGARSVNTLRALNIASDVNKNKARNGVRSAFANRLIGLMGQKGQLENQQDQMEMQGQTAADAGTAADTDNYYSNMAQNLTNFGDNIQGLGRSLNTNRKNNDDIDLLGLLSQNGIKIGRKKGKLTIVNN